MVSMNNISKKIYFVSLGCPRALVDTEVMMALLLDNGYEVTNDIEVADIFIVNTCGFIKMARDEAVEVISELFNEKKESAKVIATGCMVQNHSHILKQYFPDMHYYLGAGDVMKVLQAVEEETGEIISKDNKSFLGDSDTKRMVSTPKSYAYLKIAEGCMKKCSYCIIPNIKGHLKSKPIDVVIKEFKSLLDQGIMEIILIAQDLGDYGKDRNETNALEKLLQEILKIKGQYWIRLMYVYPDEVTDGIIDIIKNDKRVCPYLDMPIQHVSDKILSSMKRKTSKEEIISKICSLRDKVKDIVIRTSVMVGFPGETQEDFDELLQFLEYYKLDNVGVFAFSKEEGAIAATMSDQVPDKIKNDRKEKLMLKQEDVVNTKNMGFVGMTLDVVVEDYHEESDLLLVGRYQGQCPDIDGRVIINDASGVSDFNKRYKVKITDTAGCDLIGEVVV
jgi:ribosomal protein S12 methylthiotransferase